MYSSHKKLPFSVVCRSHLRLAGILITLLALALLAGTSLAAPVSGKEFMLRQPNGSRVKVRIWGDEYYQVVESFDGYTLVRSPRTQWIYYAKLSADGSELLPTRFKYRGRKRFRTRASKHIRISPVSAQTKVNAARQRFRARRSSVLSAAPAAPSLATPTGNVRGICIIIDFDDEESSISRGEVNNFCNQLGYSNNGNNGSVRDYFYDVSDGALTYTNFVPQGYYRALQDKTYYDNPAEAAGPKAAELVLEALNDLEGDGFDFSLYDSDGDNVIEGLNVFYAGTVASGWSKGLWPHAGWVTFSADGVSTDRYQITDMGDELTLATFCHENGHMLMGWNDLYDYQFDSYGIGRYGLMCNAGSNTNPLEPNAYHRAAAGWCTVIDLESEQAHTGRAVTSGVNTVYRYKHPTVPTEYFLIENKHRTGRDSALPDSGIAIWHVDENGSNNNEAMEAPSNRHYECTLVQADGFWDLERYLNEGDSTDLYAAPTHTECTPGSTPNTNWWDGTLSGMSIINVSETGTTMTFDVDWPFEDVTTAAGLTGLADAKAAWGDYNNDNWPDLYVDGVLWRNTSGTFAAVGGTPMTGDGIWGDYNNDGFLDLFCYSTLKLYSNSAGSSFVDQSANLPSLPMTDSLGAAWADFDSDGNVDLYVGGYEASPEQPDAILRNKGDGTFELFW